MKTNMYFPEATLKNCEFLLVRHNDGTKILIIELNNITGIETTDKQINYAHKIEDFVFSCILKTQEDKTKSSILIHSNSHSDNAVKQLSLQMFYDANIDTQEI